MWDTNNTEHIARHDVTPAAVEAIVFDPATRWETDDTHRRGRLVGRGMTTTGRGLVVILEPPSLTGSSYCVTARPMTNRERRAYEEESHDD